MSDGQKAKTEKGQGPTPQDYFPPKHERKLKGLRITLQTIDRIETLAEQTERTQSEVVDAAVAFFYDTLKKTDTKAREA